MLTFEVASFDIGYNCILGRPFLLRFMAAIHTAYATIKIHGPRGVITIKSDQRDALACENAALTHVGRFEERSAKLGRKMSPDRLAEPRLHSSCSALQRDPTGARWRARHRWAGLPGRGPAVFLADGA
jgi:hypothetical protein